ncbi:MAG: hypothetical protein AAGA48_38395 [Myxococcota bacterium]
MASNVAVAVQIRPERFVEQFCDGEAPTQDALDVAGLSVVLAADFVTVLTPHPPSVTIAFALARVDRALPGLQAESKMVAVGLGGGRPGPETRFEDWTEHWVRGTAPRQDERTVVEALFGAIAGGMAKQRRTAALDVGGDGHPE